MEDKNILLIITYRNKALKFPLCLFFAVFCYNKKNRRRRRYFVLIHFLTDQRRNEFLLFPVEKLELNHNPLLKFCWDFLRFLKLKEKQKNNDNKKKVTSKIK